MGGVVNFAEAVSEQGEFFGVWFTVVNDEERDTMAVLDGGFVFYEYERSLRLCGYLGTKR
jgi:hypothetical protein